MSLLLYNNAKLIILMLTIAGSFLNAQSLLLQEDFSLTANTDLAGQNSWTEGSVQANNIVVSASGLFYTGYPNSGVGNAALCVPTTDRDQRTFSGSLTGTYYYSFLLSVSSAGTGDYFIGLFSGNAFRGRVYFKADGAGLQFGLVKTTTGTVTYTSGAPYNFNTTHLLVVKYEFLSGSTTDDKVSLFIDPTIQNGEPGSANIGPLTDAGTDVSSNVIAVQGRANSGTFTIDGIRIAADWNSLLPVSTPLRSAVITVDPAVSGDAISESFVGFSFNPAYSSQFFSTSYNGYNSRTVSAKLFNNFFPYQRPGIRIIGANNSSWLRSGSAYSSVPTQWNNSAVSFPYIPATVPSITTTIDQTDLNDLEGLLDGLTYTPSILFGINLAVIDDGRSADFASKINTTLKNSQRPSLDLQFEIGNEPDAYVSNSRRLSGYGYSQFQQEFDLIANAVKPYGDIAGPTLAKPTYTQEFAGNIQNFITSVATNVGSGKLKTVTYHDYPLGCASDGIASVFLEKFFTKDSTSSRYAEKYTRLEVSEDLKPSITVARSNEVKFRMAETNSICAGGKDSASNSFGAALWAMDFMYELAKAGGDGINFAIEGSSTAVYSPWTFSSSQVGSGIVLVRPLYYGMVLFAKAVQNHAKFTANSCVTAGGPHLKVWSTKDDQGIIRVMILNKGTSLNDDTTCTVTLKIPSSVSGANMFELKPSSGGIGAMSGILLNGQSVSHSGSTAGEFTGTLSSPAVIRTYSDDTTGFTFNVSAASAMILETTSSILPVEMTSFTAEKFRSQVRLCWSTAMEISNYGFEVESRSEYGDDGQWKMIGFIPGSGNSDVPKQYFFLDQRPLSGSHQYRLKQIDHDGRYSYSPVVEAGMELAVAVAAMKNYPNPFNPVTTMQITVPVSGTAVVRIQNILGQRVAEVFRGKVEAGNTFNVTWDARNFANGIYYSVLEWNGGMLVRKMVLMK